MVKLPKGLQKKNKNKGKREEIKNLRDNNLQDYFLLNKDPQQRNESDLKLLEERLKTVRYTNERKTQFGLLLEIGETYKFLGPMEKAVEAFKQAIIIANELENTHQKFFALFQLGNAYIMQGFYNEALYYTQKAYECLEMDKNLGLFESTILDALGEIYSCLGNNKKAIDIYNKALSLVKKNKEGEHSKGLTLMSIAKVKSKMGLFSDSISLYQQALNIIRKLGDKRIEASILLELCTNYDYLGEIKKAIEYAQKSRKIYINLSLKIGIGTSSYHIGGMLFHYGDEGKALEYLSQSLKIFKEINNPLWSARTLWYLKEIYLNQGSVEKFKKAQDEALSLMQKTKSSLDLGQFLIDVTSEMTSRDYRIEDENEKVELLKISLDLQKKCLDTFQNTDSPQLIGKALTGIGYTYVKLKNYSEALKFYSAAVATYNSSGTINFLAITYTRIGELYRKQDNPTKALEYYRKSLKIYQKMLEKLEGTNLYLNFKSLFSFLPMLIEDIKETIYKSCFMENQSEIIENTKILAIDVCKKAVDANLKQIIPEIGKNSEAIREIINIAKKRKEEIKDLQAEITVIKNNHYKNKDHPEYYETITKKIITILKDETPHLEFWQERLNNNNFNQLYGESKEDLIAIRILMNYLDDYLEICLFQIAKIIEREIQHKIFEKFRNITQDLNQFTFNLKGSTFSGKIIKKIEHSHRRLLSFLNRKVKLTLGDFGLILEHVLLLQEQSIKVKLFDELGNFIINSISNKEQGALVDFLVRPFKFLNIPDSRFKDTRFNDLRNYVAHPKDSTSRLQLKINKAFINRLIDIITDRAPFILPTICKFY